MQDMSVQLRSVRQLTDDDVDGNASAAPVGLYVIYWIKLTYIVCRGSVDKLIGKLKGESPVPPDSRTILDSVSGSVTSGQMTALMGPSGAGKTTLLECLIGKRQKGLSGQVKVKLQDCNVQINLALVPQKSDFFESLTVFETINYSSRLKNSSIREFNHDSVTKEVIKKLDLEKVQSRSVSTLSGSEKKRLSIGIEIVSHPNLLVLDEPTTGLDSFAADSVCSNAVLVVTYLFTSHHDMSINIWYGLFLADRQAIA